MYSRCLQKLVPSSLRIFAVSALLCAWLPFAALGAVNCGFPQLNYQKLKLTKGQKQSHRMLSEELHATQETERDKALGNWAEIYLPDQILPSTFVAIVSRAIAKKALTHEHLDWIQGQSSRFALTLNGVATIKNALWKASKKSGLREKVEASFKEEWGQNKISMERNNLALTEKETRFYRLASKHFAQHKIGDKMQAKMYDQLFNVQLSPHEFMRIMLALIHDKGTVRQTGDWVLMGLFTATVIASPLAIEAHYKLPKMHVSELVAGLREFSENYDLSMEQIHRLQQEILEHHKNYSQLEINLPWGKQQHSRMAGSSAKADENPEYGEIPDNVHHLPPLRWTKPKLTREQNNAHSNLSQDISIADRPELALNAWSKKNLPPTLDPSSFAKMIARGFQKGALTIEHLDWIRDESARFAITLNDVVSIRKAALKSAPTLEQIVDDCFAAPWGRDHWRLAEGRLALNENEIKVATSAVSSNAIAATITVANLNAEEFTNVMLHLLQSNINQFAETAILTEIRGLSSQHDLNVRQIQILQQTIVDVVEKERAEEYVNLPWGKGQFGRQTLAIGVDEIASHEVAKPETGLQTDLASIQAAAQELARTPSPANAEVAQRVAEALEALKQAQLTLEEGG